MEMEVWKPNQQTWRRSTKGKKLKKDDVKLFCIYR